MIFHTGDVRRNCIKIQLAELQEDIQDTGKLHTRTLKKRTNQSSPLQGEIEGVGNILPHG